MPGYQVLASVKDRTGARLPNRLQYVPYGSLLPSGYSR